MKPNFFIFLLLTLFSLEGCSKVSKGETVKPLRTPIMGWSSWNAYRGKISEDIIKHNADLLVKKGLKDYGYNHVNIDDGFFGVRDKNGKMLTNNRFPNGLKVVSDYIHSLGLKAGIYTDAGYILCTNVYDGETYEGRGIYGHESQDLNYFFNECNFDFFKIDYCGGLELGVDEKERYTYISDCVRKLNKDISINICRWAFPGTWAKDIASSWRISGDIGAHWESIKYVIDKNLYLSAYAGDGHYNDMDMMVIGLGNDSKVGGSGLTQNEEKAHFGMWCIMSSPLVIGCNLENIPDESLEILKNKELIAINQDPLGLQAYVVQHEKEGYVLVKDIETKWGTTRAVALYNPSDTICNFSVPFSLLDLEGNVKVRDLSELKDLGVYKNKFDYTLPAHSAMILRCEAEKRLEPIKYEGEWAYLNLFNDIEAKERRVLYTNDNNASGGKKISFLGGHSENYAEWDNVYSINGGNYNMDIRYEYGKGRRIELYVNDKLYLIDNLADDNGWHNVNVPIELKKGENTVRIGCSNNWAPNIDCFYLK